MNQKNYGGFYTHEDIKENYKICRRTVCKSNAGLMYGPGLAAIASILSCLTEGADKYNVRRRAHHGLVAWCASDNNAG